MQETIKIGILINMCSSEAPFLSSMLRECTKFAYPENIVISYADRLYNGDPDDTSYITRCNMEYPAVRCVRYDVDVHLPHHKRRGVENRPTAYWHNLARFTGVTELLKDRGDVDWVFVVDGDEIPDGARVAEWLAGSSSSSSGADPSVCYKMATYWYFKLPIYQALTHEDSILLIHKSHLTAANIFGDMERDHTIARSGTRLMRMTNGKDGLPLWHHYSFVRTRENLRKKLTCWAHRDDVLNLTDVDVDIAIQHVFAHGQVNDFIHGYTY